MDFSSGIGLIVAVVVVVIGIVMAVLAFLMPYFVWQIHDNLKQLIRIATDAAQEGTPAGIHTLRLGRAQPNTDFHDLGVVLMRNAEVTAELERSVRALTIELEEGGKTTRTQVIAALAEQQGTINALYRRLDALEGRSEGSSEKDVPGEFAPPIPLQELFDDDKEE